MTTSQFSIDGRHAIVTGSSRGIGCAIAKKYAADGANVVLCALESERERLEEVESTIEAADHDGHAHAVTCDVTNRSDVERLVTEAQSAFGDVDILVNNVGGSRTIAFADLTPEDWEGILTLNLRGTFNCSQLVGEQMRESGGGAIVNIASGAGLQGFPNSGPYGVAKAGIVNLTETLAFEWAYDDVRVNAIAPGLIATKKVRDAPEMHVPAPEEIDRETVARRVGLPEEIADMAQVLVSPAASFITGQTVFVGGVPRLERQFEVGKLSPDESAWVW